MRNKNKNKNKNKNYTRMTTSELAEATRDLEKEFVFEKGKPLEAKDRKAHAAARRRGRPRIGLGAEKIRVTIERGLLREADRFARSRGMSRSEMIARGLRAVLAIG